MSGLKSTCRYCGLAPMDGEPCCAAKERDCAKAAVRLLQKDLARLRARNEHLEATIRTVLSWTIARDVREYLEGNLETKA